MNVFSLLARGATRSPGWRRTQRNGIMGVLLTGALVATGLVILDATPAAASTITLNASGSGNYRDSGYHESANPNYITGSSYVSPSWWQYNDFFVFNLSGVSCTVTSATLRAPNPNPASGPLDTLSLRAVTTSISALTASHATGDSTGQAIYADLADGTLYGSVAITASVTNPVDVELNADGLAALNAARGTSVALGGNYPGLAAGYKYLFSGTDSTTVPQLILGCVDTVPAAPAAPTAVPGDGQVALTWSAPADGGSPITSYTVAYRISSSADAWSTTTVPASPTTIPGLTNGTSYDFKVLASNLLGDGPYSSVTAATPTPSTAVPDAPTDLQAVAGDGQVTLTWTAAYDGGSTILGYTVAYREADGHKWITEGSTGSPTTIHGLTNNVQYAFKVSASNVNGNGPYSTEAYATPFSATAPGVPTDVTADVPAVNGRTMSTVVHWTNTGLPSDQYVVTAYAYRAGNKGTPTYRELFSVTVTGVNRGDCQFTGLSLHKAYAFTVKAGNSSGWSLPSDYSNTVQAP